MCTLVCKHSDHCWYKTIWAPTFPHYAKDYLTAIERVSSELASEYKTKNTVEGRFGLRRVLAMQACRPVF